MLRTDEILSTIHMLHAEHLDVRTVTLALNVEDCAAPNIDHLCKKLRQKIHSRASRLVEICDKVGTKYGIPVINKRLAISPAATLLAGHGRAAALAVAKTLDAVAAECRVDFVGGFTALVQKGISSGDECVIQSLPEVLSQTQRVCASVNVASRRAGINMDAVHLMGHVLLKIAAATADRRGFGCAKLVIFANIPEDNPFMAGAYMGSGEPEAAINIGVSGPGVVSSALKRRLALGEKLTLGDLAEEIKITSFRVTRVGELIGREVAAGTGRGLRHRRSVAGAHADGRRQHRRDPQDAGHQPHRRPRLDRRRGHAQRRREEGRAVRLQFRRRPERRVHPRERRRHAGRGRRPGASRARKAGSHDQRLLGRARHDRHPRRHARPRPSPRIIADEMAIGVINDKTTAVRLIPVPGAKAGDVVDFGGLFGSTPVMEVRNSGASDAFVHFGGRIPAPMQALRN